MIREEKIKLHLKKFEPISLEEMDSVKLLSRTDTKYVLPAFKLYNILEEVNNGYKLLYINEISEQVYHTVYYDTQDFEMYYAHQNGRSNRFKVRYRTYLSTDASFMEVKFKNNKGRTDKRRIPFKFEKQNQSEVNKFLTKNCPYSIENISPQSIVEYTRLTLVDIKNGERVTIDYNLRFSEYNNPKNTTDFCHVAIIEVKRDKSNGNSLIIQSLLKNRIFTSSLSKYCLGVASFKKDIKQNRFKLQLKKIEKLKKHTSR